MALSSSAYFAMGAVAVTIAVIVFLITPLISQMKQLDKVVMAKLSALPSIETYATLFDIITQQNVYNDGLLREYNSIKKSVDGLTEVVGGLNDFQEACDIKMGKFMSNLDNLKHSLDKLEDSLEEYTVQLEFNANKSSKQINSLVRARIGTTSFLINLIDMLKTTDNIPSGFNGSQLYEIREELKVDAENIKNMNYISPSRNTKSGTVNKLTDSEY